MAGCITILCCILGRFSIFLRFVRSYACELHFDWKTLSIIFFCRFVFHIREIMCANNCVFHCVHKEIDNAFSPGDNYSFCESGLQITLRLLSSRLGNSSFAYVISRIRNTNWQKKQQLDNVYQSNCSSHAKLLTNLRKIEKLPKMRHKMVMHPALQLFHRKVASLLNIYIQYTQHSSDLLAHNSVHDISAVAYNYVNCMQMSKVKTQDTNNISRWFILIFIYFSQLFWCPCVDTRSPSASLPIQGQVTKHTTVKWVIAAIKYALYLKFH